MKKYETPEVEVVLFEEKIMVSEEDLVIGFSGIEDAGEIN